MSEKQDQTQTQTQKPPLIPDIEVVIGPVQNHRSREEGVIVYPVYSRRSKGISVGIDLYPDRKVCSFNCPYCEVFPFQTHIRFSVTTMKASLHKLLTEPALTAAAASEVQSKSKNTNPACVRDLCFSGNGEPTLSPLFPQALTAANEIRCALAPQAKLVVITNGTGLLNKATYALLRDAAALGLFPTAPATAAASPTLSSAPPSCSASTTPPTTGSASCSSTPTASSVSTPAIASTPNKGLTIWLKLDAGTEAWYQKINRPYGSFSTCAGNPELGAGVEAESGIGTGTPPDPHTHTATATTAGSSSNTSVGAFAFGRLTSRIREFVGVAPVTIQTMVCAVEGHVPPPEEAQAWVALVVGLVVAGWRAKAKEKGKEVGVKEVQIYGKARPAPEDPLATQADVSVLEARAAALRIALAAAAGREAEIDMPLVEVYP